MGWLADWDDVVHGTVVFGAIMPFGVALLLGWLLPTRLWSAVAGGLVIPVLWIFGWPSWPLRGSDNIAAVGLVIATLVVSWERRRQKLLAIASGGYLGVHFFPEAPAAGWKEICIWIFIIAGTAISITGWAALVKWAAREGPEDDGHTHRLTPATWVPPSIALAVLLQLAGTTRFAQCAGALGAATGAVCLLLLYGRGQAGLDRLASLWGIFSALLGWAGWLYANVCVPAVLLLLLTPLSAYYARRLNLPRTEFRTQLCDGLAASGIASLAIVVAWLKYNAIGDSSGY